MLESFESSTFPPPGWTKKNLQGGSGWYQLPIGVMPLPGWGNGTSSVPATAEAGSHNAYCSWTTGGGSSEGYHNDQWLISPRLSGLTPSSTLSYWLRFCFTNFPDTVYVRISTTGPDPANFTIIAQTNVWARSSGGSQFPPWFKRTIKLGDFGIPPGTPIWIAFQEYAWDNVHDGAAIQLDVISSDLTAPPQPATSPTSLTFDAYIDGTNASDKTFSIQNIGCSGLSFSNRLTFGSGPTNWLTLSGPSIGTVARMDSQVYTAAVAHTGLDLGSYCATNVITIPGATNSPLRIPITLNVIRRPQTVAFPNPGSQLTTNIVHLAGTASSGLPLFYSLYSGPGKLSEGSNLTFTAAGVVKVMAWQLGDPLWDCAPPVTISINVTKAGQAIDFPAIGNLCVTSTVPLAATASSGLPVTFEVASGPAVISEGTNLAFTGPGVVSILASQAGNAMYEAAPPASNAFRVSDLYSLTVVSPYGTACPAAGEHTFWEGTVLTNTVSTPDTYGATQYVCAGWVMSSHAPTLGAGTQVVMTVTNSSVLTWQWSTNYWLVPAAGPNGSIDAKGGWCMAGTTTQITATADSYYHFANWSGDAAGSANPLNLLMNTPKSVTAHFEENRTTSRPTPEWWLAKHGITNNFEAAVNDDPDHDGAPTGDEYVMNTDPTNGLSVLRLTGIVPSATGWILTWPCATDRVYDVQFTRTLSDHAWLPVPGKTNLMSTTERLSITNPPDADARQFYRLKVRLP
ncbi:MAG TPA: choice-of-anchor J domain-containing protein [Candidatus Hydrogenedentes bacterium]|nr:choice-of-anchor J domain-containing protein [Candidatus Hydrogenedentota bacterium]HPA06733.1 choice-of-anchor J domain-containing protein [Candidatus Hydrogenedentota bacterium]HQM51415.1 choice-of-anchor J domain-containing protein [Candidatus Hydrogenedentota bacterium]